MSEPIRVMPMWNPLPLWDKDSESEYPDALKMAFRDGQTRVYRLVVEQPKPQIDRAAEILRRNTFGGGYHCKHGKSR